jgi:hypothetical protein
LAGILKLDCKNPGKALAVLRVEIFKDLIDVAGGANMHLQFSNC